MLRFPNPGSNIHNFIAVYRTAYKQLHTRIVNLDDLVKVVVAANMATSSGYMGSEAILRSTRRNRSRDPLYNQLKMYAELYRALGWLHPTKQSALNYTFTLLGRQIVDAGPNWEPLLEETALGIAYPSHVLQVSGNHDIRPIAFLLRTMLECGGALSRDEMIVGPLNAHSDRSEDSARDMADLVKHLRQSSSTISKAMSRVARERNLKVNTLKNYTRWPIAIMRDLDWTEKVRLKFENGKRSFEAHKLTDKGLILAKRVSQSADLRVDQVEELPTDEKSAICFYSFYEMLMRAGFDISSVHKKLQSQESALARAYNHLGIERSRPLLFSPFQSLEISDIQQLFPAPEKRKTVHEEQFIDHDVNCGQSSHKHLYVVPELIGHTNKINDTHLIEKLENLRNEYSSVEKAACAFSQLHESDTKKQFYPLICQLFQLLDFQCKLSRIGVNYQRWDACVWLEENAVPVEIKSPTEEAFLSTKAIRQALENKIVLLARGSLETTFDITSLVVGYQFPNERGDMLTIIDDIYKAFGIKIGVIDLKTLTSLAIYSVTENRTIKLNQVRNLRGFLSV